MPQSVTKRGAEWLEVQQGLQSLSAATPKRTELMLLLADSLVMVNRGTEAWNMVRQSKLKDRPVITSPEPTTEALEAMAEWSREFAELLEQPLTISLPSAVSREMLKHFKDDPDPRAVAACGCLFGIGEPA